MEHTKIKVVAGQEYICLMTNNINEGDLIVKSLDPIDRPVEHSLNKVTFVNKRANVFRYDKVSGDGNHSFGLDVFRSMTDLSKYMGRKCNMELDILHAKVVGKGVSNRFSASEMAEWFHNNYEEIAKAEGWQTQDKCKVEFKDLPEKNKSTMIKVCERWLNGC